MLVAALTVAVLPFSRGFLEADPAVLAAASAAPVDSLAPLETAAAAMPPGFASAEVPDFTSLSSIPATVFADTDEMLGSARDVAPAVMAEPFVLDMPLGPPLSRPVRLLTVGDSTAFYLGQH